MYSPNHNFDPYPIGDRTAPTAPHYNEHHFTNPLPLGLTNLHSPTNTNPNSTEGTDGHLPDADG